MVNRMLDHNRDFHLHPRQCVSCEGESPSCNCASDENCVLTSRTCSQCPTIQCNKKPGSSGGGVNPGVIAGPVVAILVIASLVLFWYLRRKKRRDLARLEELAARARKAEIAGFHLSQPGSPSPGSARSLPHSSRSRSSRQLAQSHSRTSAQQGDKRRSAARSPLPPAQMNAEYYDKSGDHIRVYGGNGHINVQDDERSDPFSDMGDAATFSTRNTGETGNNSTNIIPIQYDPGNGSDDSHEGHGGGNGNGKPKSQAARTLNEARENLFRGGQPVPQRPARAPGLDLRLNPSTATGEEGDERTPGGQQGGGGGIRDSYLSGTSGAPSFSSGYTTDLHTDAPKIFTSRHVQLGRFQQAEVVSFGQQQIQHPPAAALTGSGSTSPTLLAVRSPYEPSTNPSRTLTPSGSGRRYDEEELPSPDPNHHPPPSNASPTDLRFSMGSLAGSVSSMGTERYLARPDSSFGPIPRAPWVNGGGGGGGTRESMMSGRSEADSVLGGYPMIPPSSAGLLNQNQHFPQSSSVASTLDGHLAGPGPGPARPYPPPTYRSPIPESTRPQTSASMADSILGSFPFVPPAGEDPALPSARIPETAGKTGNMARSATARNTAMSGVSEGLGGFEFRWNGEDHEGGDVPPLPSGMSMKGNNGAR